MESSRIDNMNSFKHIHARRGRKLPYVARRKKLHLFWPTYRGAVNWMRQHQKIIDTAVDLLEIYPNLVTDSSLDSLWEFIKPFLDIKTYDATNVKQKDTKPKLPQRLVLPKISPKVPLISVQPDSDSEERDSDIVFETETEHLKTPRVYLCGKLKTKHRIDSSSISESLSSNFFVHCGSQTNKLDVLYDSDFLVYLLSDFTLTNIECCQKLITAWSRDIPTVFVRDKNFKLSSPLPETFLDQALKSDEFLSLSGTERRRCTASVGLYQTRQGKPVLKRSDSSISALEPESAESEPQPSLNSSNVVLYLINGYREAIVFDERFPLSAVQEIKSYITATSVTNNNDLSMGDISSVSSRTHEHFILSSNPNLKRDKLLSVPTITSPYESDVSAGVSRSSSAVSQDSLSVRTCYLDVPSVNGIDRDPDSGIHSPIEKETCYIVYPDPLNSPINASPKVVKWPPADDNFCILSPESSVGSPITFTDIDLSKEINYDLYSPDESDIFD